MKRYGIVLLIIVVALVATSATVAFHDAKPTPASNAIASEIWMRTNPFILDT